MPLRLPCRYSGRERIGRASRGTSLGAPGIQPGPRHRPRLEPRRRCRATCGVGQITEPRPVSSGLGAKCGARHTVVAQLASERVRDGRRTARPVPAAARTCSSSGEASTDGVGCDLQSELSHGRPAWYRAASCSRHGAETQARAAATIQWDPVKFTASSNPFTARRAASLAPSIVARSVCVAHSRTRKTGWNRCESPRAQRSTYRPGSPAAARRFSGNCGCADRLDIRVEEPRVQVFVAQQLAVDVDRALQLLPCLAHHLLARALHGRPSVRTRGRPVRNIDRKDAAHVAVAEFGRATSRQNWSWEMLLAPIRCRCE